MKEQSSGEIRSHFELNEDKNTTYQSVCNSVKAGLGEKRTDLRIRREDRSKIKHLLPPQESGRAD